MYDACMHSLVLQEISKRFTTADVLHSISFAVEPGQRVALVGESGSGKTTLLRIVAGLEQPTAGRVRIKELDVTSWPANKRGIGVVFQDYATYPRLTVSENLTVSLVGGGIDRAEKESRLSEVSEWLGLQGLLKRLPTELSGGQLQRVALGKVLMARPSLLLLDEPFSQLDVRLAQQMRGLLAECHQRYGTTQLMVTHDPLDALTAVDKLAVLSRGRLAQFAAPDEIRRQPSTLFAAELTSPCGLNVLPAEAFHERLSARIASGAAGPGSIVAVRPEAIRLQTSADQTGCVALETRMSGLRDLGIVRLAELSWGSAKLNMVWPHDACPVCPGDRVNCVIRGEDLMTFVD